MARSPAGDAGSPEPWRGGGGGDPGPPRMTPSQPWNPMAPPPPARLGSSPMEALKAAAATRFQSLAPRFGSAQFTAGSRLMLAAPNAGRLATGASLASGGDTDWQQPRYISTTGPPGHGEAGRSDGGGATQVATRHGVAGQPAVDIAALLAMGRGDGQAATLQREHANPGSEGAPAESEEQAVASLLVAFRAAEAPQRGAPLGDPHQLAAAAVRAALAVAAAAPEAAQPIQDPHPPPPSAAPRPADDMPPPPRLATPVPGLDGPLIPDVPRPLAWEDITREASVSSRDPQLAGATLEQLVEAAAVYDHPGARVELRARLALAVATLRAQIAAGHSIHGSIQPPQPPQP